MTLSINDSVRNFFCMRENRSGWGRVRSGLKARYLREKGWKNCERRASGPPAFRYAGDGHNRPRQGVKVDEHF